ncbi:hypothetical protein MAR_020081, partial [Mya arenaria]
MLIGLFYRPPNTSAPQDMRIEESIDMALITGIHFANFDWDSIRTNDLNSWVSLLTSHILEGAKRFIPNKTITIRPQEPRWITSEIKRLIRKRKRLYQEAKRHNISSVWNKFKDLRNTIISKIRDAKKAHIDTISKSLLDKKNSKDWWSTVKQFMSPSS